MRPDCLFHAEETPGLSPHLTRDTEISWDGGDGGGGGGGGREGEGRVPATPLLNYPPPPPTFLFTLLSVPYSIPHLVPATPLLNSPPPPPTFLFILLSVPYSIPHLVPATPLLNYPPPPPTFLFTLLSVPYSIPHLVPATPLLYSLPPPLSLQDLAPPHSLRHIASETAGSPLRQTADSKPNHTLTNEVISFAPSVVQATPVDTNCSVAPLTTV
ncbi:hypothetical protein Pcinc_041244 [Petrolisthes cinctipes]|uniref:Uncharacterized protein n=1 Tax=Petrolisthes cinctipes TaxID=88211 RepID=A0AAE1BJZ3_PETCI|nr:hypothetical protein Pcinc_041244 [Petrolisthes cinctipes]